MRGGQIGQREPLEALEGPLCSGESTCLQPFSGPCKPLGATAFVSFGWATHSTFELEGAPPGAHPIDPALWTGCLGTAAFISPVGVPSTTRTLPLLLFSPSPSFILIRPLASVPRQPTSALPSGLEYYYTRIRTA